ncbi:glycosyl transferase, group 1 [Vibrio cholerae]|uniref:glycosyltransferase family 4 protein n=1 Tax=Vibrio cholerae TaxID=666 RepID=UPI000619039F|nr:glycosyltransferase family 4 protein [Vibrio cholerae]CFW14595.1 glycosyl transferase, group 1 [Vibrio cholerae]CPR25461.1 glycosyl transferase, group 1 [Vibrio cholerae]CPR25462.1 glycosyl transferase, group 1 [Vibrio cholerae]
MYKILIFCPDFYPRNTGYANAFRNFIHVLSDSRKYKIDVVTDVLLGENQELKIDNVNIIRKKKKSNVKLVRFIANQMDIANELTLLDKENDYDLIMMETFEYSLVPLFLSDNIMNKFTARIHACYETERRFFYPGLLHYINRKIVSKLVSMKLKYYMSTNSYHIDFAKRYFLEGNLFKICNKDFFVLPNCFKQAIETNSNQSLMKEANKKIEMLSLGRMDQSGKLQKGFSDLLGALFLASDELRDKVNYTIIGRGESLEHYRSFARNNDLDFVEFVEFEQHEDVINRLSNKCDVVILPSRYEGMSMFALEAIATSNAVIFSNSGGLVDMCDDGFNGFLVPPQDIEALALALINMASDESRIEEMKVNSSKLYQRKFSAQVIENKFEKIVRLVKAGL